MYIIRGQYSFRILKDLNGRILQTDIRNQLTNRATDIEMLENVCNRATEKWRKCHNCNSVRYKSWLLQ